MDIVEIQVEDLLLSVDYQTAVQLEEDVSFRNKYIDEVRKQFNTEIENPSGLLQVPNDDTRNVNEQPVMPVWTSKNQSDRDQKATMFFLNLRKHYEKEFNDKLTNKNTIWAKIAAQMNEENFFVGSGVEGREKCRQKFSNLQASYIRYTDKKRQTGEGRLQKPPYYDILNEIFAGKHKIEPVLIIDSAKKKSLEKGHSTAALTGEDDLKHEEKHSEKDINYHDVYATSPSTSTESESCLARSNKENKFSNVKKSVKPDKHKLLEKFVQVSEESLETNKKNFSDMMNYLKDEGERRHQQVMALITSMKGAGRKRKRNDNEDSD